MGEIKFKKFLNHIEEEMHVDSICRYYQGIYDFRVIQNAKKTNIYSLSKNVTTLCIGILYDKGLLSLDDDVADIFLMEYPSSISYRGVTIEKVMMQVTGIEKGFLDIDCDDFSSYPSDDYLEVVFKFGRKYQDFSHFVYSDSNYYLLGRIAEKKGNMPLDKMIEEYILRPLDIENYDFQYCTKGHQMGATGIFLDAKDVCKIASIFLNEGMYNGKRIVSKEYIDMCMTPRVDADEKTAYGYSIWIDKKSGIRYGMGMLGQMFALISKEEIISFVSYDLTSRTNILKELLLEKEDE